MLVAEVGLGGQRWVAWVGAFLLSQPAPDPIVNPFQGPSPRLCTRSESGLQPCKPILSSVQMILVGGVSMLHDPVCGPGGGVEVLVDGWQFDKGTQ